MFVLAIDIDLAEELEVGLVAVAGPDVLEDVQNLEILLLGLVAVLIARKTKHGEVVVGAVEGIHLLEIPDSRAS